MLGTVQGNLIVSNGLAIATVTSANLSANAILQGTLDNARLDQDLVVETLTGNLDTTNLVGNLVADFYLVGNFAGTTFDGDVVANNFFGNGFQLTDVVKTADFELFNQTQKRIFVSSSKGDDDLHDGKTENKAFRTIKKAAEIAQQRGFEDGASGVCILVETGEYTEDNPIFLSPRTSVIGDNLRQVLVFPQNPRADIFHVSNGCYINRLRFLNLRAPAHAVAFPCALVESFVSEGGMGVSPGVLFSYENYEAPPNVIFDPPRLIGRDASARQAQGYATLDPVTGAISGIVITDPGQGYSSEETPLVSIPPPMSKRPFVTASPYIFDCSSITGPFTFAGTIIPATTPLPYSDELKDTINPNGAGGGLRVDGNCCHPQSALRSMVAASYTQVNQGGPGFLITNLGYAQLVSCFTTFCSYGVKTSSGGRVNLSNSVTDFGDYGLWGEGYHTTPFLTANIAETLRSNVAFVHVTSGGDGYTSTPNIAIITPPGAEGSGAVASVVIDPFTTEVIQVDMVSTGFGYDAIPDVVIFGGGLGNVATATATVSNGSVTVVTLGDTGSEYVSTPEVLFFPATGDDGFGASATANLDTVTGTLSDILVTYGGEGYQAPPRVVINGGKTGNVATAVAKMTGVNEILMTGFTEVEEFDGTARAIATLDEGGSVSNVVLTFGGTVYGSAPTVVVGDGGANVTAIVSNSGQVVDLVVEDPGVGSTNANVTISGGRTSTAYPDRRPDIGSILYADGDWRMVAGAVDLGNAQYRVTMFPQPLSVDANVASTFHQVSTISTGSHVFEYVGSGTSYNALPQFGGIPDGQREVVNYSPSIVAKTVYFTSTDDKGNYKVGDLFSINQATGTVQISTDQFSLSGLNAIGPFRRSGVTVGVQLQEVSNDPLLRSSTGRDESTTVPTQSAVVAYVGSRRLPLGGAEGAFLRKFAPGDGQYAWTSLVDLPNLNVGQVTVSGNVLPSANVTYDLGSSTSRWKDLYLSGNSIYLGNTVIQESGGGGGGVTLGDTTVQGDVTIHGNLTVLTGNVVEIQTETQVTDQLIVTNAGTGPALVVDQTGSEDIADFKDDGSVVVRIHDGGSMSVGGDVAAPQGTLHVVGNVYASGVYIGNGAGLTSLNASELTSGIVPAARFGANVAIGTGAGLTEQGENAVAVGLNAGSNIQGSNAVAVGISAGQTSQGPHSVAVGFGAGSSNQSSNSVAVGREAGQTLQGQFSTAVGFWAGLTLQGNGAVAIGTVAGSNMQGLNAVAVGANAGLTEQGENAVAIGLNAGSLNQNRWGVALGTSAGYSNQGEFATAVGGFAGCNAQGNVATALGYAAGRSNQDTWATAVGYIAGSSNQGSCAVALGAGAGRINQGSNAVAIGYLAGSNAQANNSIVISATGLAVNNTVENSTVIKPVRDRGATARSVMLYEESTGEVTTSTNGMTIDASGNVSLSSMIVAGTPGEIRFVRHDGVTSRYHRIENSVTGAASDNYMAFNIHNGTLNSTTNVMTLRGNGNVGIVQTNPAYTLDVTGTGRFTGALQLPLGTAAAPSLYFGTDTNTGLYSPAGNDTLNLTTNGTVALSIDSLGTIDIAQNINTGFDGTSHPVGDYRIRNHGVTTAGAFVAANDGYTDVWGLRNGTSDNNAVFYAVSGNVPRMLLDKAGRVYARNSVHAGVQRTDAGASTTYTAGDFVCVAYGGTGGVFTGATDGQTYIRGCRNALGGDFSLFYADSGGLVRGKFDKNGSWFARNSYHAGLVRGDNSTTNVPTAGNHGFFAYDTVITSTSIIRAANVSGATLVIDVLVANARKFSVTSAGALNSVTGNLTGHSDMKLKRDISDAHSQWEDLKKMKWRRYRLKREVEEHGEDAAKYYLGVIVQEIQDTSPHLVDPMYKTDENHNNTDEIDFYTVNYGAIWMKSAACLKEAMLRIEALEAENAALKTQMANFEARLAALESASASASAST